MNNENKNLYASDYYRMTGKQYKMGLESFVRRCLFHNLQFAYWFRKYQKTQSILAKTMLYKISRKYGLPSTMADVLTMFSCLEQRMA